MELTYLQKRLGDLCRYMRAAEELEKAAQELEEAYNRPGVWVGITLGANQGLDLDRGQRVVAEIRSQSRALLTHVKGQLFCLEEGIPEQIEIRMDQEQEPDDAHTPKEDF